MAAAVAAKSRSIFTPPSALDETVAEITRILRSGGIFVGTTFLRSSPSTPWMFKPLTERVLPSGNYLREEEIEDLCTSCGLTNYSSKVEQSFIIFSAQKP